MKEILTGEPLPLGRMPGGGFHPMPAAERSRREAEAGREQADYDRRQAGADVLPLRARLRALIAGDELLSKAPPDRLVRAMRINAATAASWQSADADA